MLFVFCCTESADSSLQAATLATAGRNGRGGSVQSQKTQNFRQCQTAGSQKFLINFPVLFALFAPQNPEFLLCQFSVDPAFRETFTFTGTVSNPRLRHEPVWWMKFNLDNVYLVFTAQKTHCALVTKSSRTMLLRAIVFCNPRITELHFAP